MLLCVPLTDAGTNKGNNRWDPGHLGTESAKAVSHDEARQTEASQSRLISVPFGADGAHTGAVLPSEWILNCCYFPTFSPTNAPFWLKFNFILDPLSKLTVLLDSALFGISFSASDISLLSIRIRLPFSS